MAEVVQRGPASKPMSKSEMDVVSTGDGRTMINDNKIVEIHQQNDRTASI